LQGQLLRALQEQEVEPLGSNRVVKVDVRVIAATSRDLKALVATSRFREDLFYRLNVLPIRVPALRERVTDLEALTETLLENIAARTGMPQRELAPSALAALAAHDWPGNIRELRTVLEQAAMLTDNARLSAEDLASILPGKAASKRSAAVRPLPQLVAELERRSIESALAATRGNKVSAAKLLGISRATLYEKLAALQVSGS
jgi:DNA-binding NtrC family response regulator